MLDQVLDTWQINHRVNLTLLDGIDEAGLRCTLSARGGRDVARQFAHMHDVRFGWLEAYWKDLAKTLKKFPSKESPSRTELKRAHGASTEAMAAMFRREVGRDSAIFSRTKATTAAASCSR